MLGGYDHPLLNRWLKAGYAVVQTDYEGLGTPGDHPYLIGVSEGRSVLDMVPRRAQAGFDGSASGVVIAGHSQGGHAALWAASLQRKWAPELTLRGTVAFAPASHIGDQAALLRALDRARGGLSGLAALIIRGHRHRPAGPERPGRPQRPREGALPGDRAPSAWATSPSQTSFGGLAPAELLRPDTPIDAVVAALNANDPETLTRPRPGPDRAGRRADTTVFPNFTQSLVSEIKATVTYKTYNGVDHGGVVTQSRSAGERTRRSSSARGRLAPRRRRLWRSPGCSRRRWSAGPPAPSPSPG